MEFEASSFLSVVASLLILEILLSVDNALVNVSIARKLPPEKRHSAVRWGIALAAGFRVIALLLASLIIKNVWLKVLGALYLLYLMFDHLGKGNTHQHSAKEHTSYKRIVMRIAFTDIVFSIDNVVSAIGLSTNITYVITGVLIGIFSILLMSKAIIKVVDVYPHLANAGYAIVGFIGITMLIEQLAHWHMATPHKFFVIVAMAIFTIFYERNANVRKLSSPILQFLQSILRLPYQMLASLR